MVASAASDLFASAAFSSSASTGRVVRPATGFTWAHVRSQTVVPTYSIAATDRSPVAGAIGAVDGGVRVRFPFLCIWMLVISPSSIGYM